MQRSSDRSLQKLISRSKPLNDAIIYRLPYLFLTRSSFLDRLTWPPLPPVWLDGWANWASCAEALTRPSVSVFHSLEQRCALPRTNFLRDEVPSRMRPHALSFLRRARRPGAGAWVLRHQKPLIDPEGERPCGVGAVGLGRAGGAVADCYQSKLS